MASRKREAIFVCLSCVRWGLLKGPRQAGPYIDAFSGMTIPPREK